MNYVEVYVPVLNGAKVMHVLKITASDVFLIGLHFLIDKNCMTLHI